MSVERLEAALVHIKHKLRATGEREVKSLVVGELVMGELQKLDEVDYSRCALAWSHWLCICGTQAKSVLESW